MARQHHEERKGGLSQQQALPQAGEEEASAGTEAAASKERMKQRTPRVDWAEWLMPRCRVAELWACTAAGADLVRVHFDHEDRIPGLVGGFLAFGAAAVIDLAWPVHDVVKALVCEQYGWRSRRTGLSGPS